MNVLGNQETISDLMDRYGTSILHLAYSFVRNRQTAEDLTQEIFIKCYEKLDTFEGTSSIQTWLYRIAVNHCKDYVKSWHYRKVHVSDYISAFLTGQQNGPEIQHIQKSENRELLQEILKLPVKYKEIILLYFYHDLTLKEVSTVLSLNINTAKSRFIRAKELLKDSIVERSPEYGSTSKRSNESTPNGRIS
ncbi:sigma-70 family RNA polymerase sigma factor [Bacillus sp. BGMRC 2118]|nr:sigma-70 family RNA polymerase sigma factor [Bacillus sp. BGMRC 2118]